MAKGELTQNLAAEDLLAEAARWRDQGHKVALATVVKTWGSSPRPVGSQLIVDDRLRLQGSVSGGCIEGAVVPEAQARSETRRVGEGCAGTCRTRRPAQS